MTDILALLRPPGAAGAARRVTVGLNWTLVEGPSGVGLCHTPAKTTQGCKPLAGAGGLAGTPLAALADLAGSDNPAERAVGFAAINAHWNRPDLEGPDENGLELVEDRGKRTVIVGRFPELERRLPGAAVIEREPGPKDFPPEAARELIPPADYLVITASTVANGSFGELIALRRSAFTVLLGPSTPFCPALYELGIGALSGLIVTDPDGAARVVAEGGAVRGLRPFSRRLTLLQTRPT